MQNRELLNESQWLEPDLTLYEGSRPLSYSLSGLIAFHGYSSIGGAVLGFRLIQRAAQLFELHADTGVQREAVSIETGFPGPGAKDAFEYLLRSNRDGRYRCDTELQPPDVQKGFQGSFYFRISMGDFTVELTPVKGYPPESFFAAGKAAFAAPDSEAAQGIWHNEKVALANTLLSSKADQCIRLVQPVANPS